MKLSIVICVYNTKSELLSECLGSITDSTLFSPPDLFPAECEIVMVDDGSDIDYTELIRKYNVKYTKTENRGIFRARLLGAELAEGDYVAFADSDDTVSFNYHLPMLMRAQDTGADIVINDWAYHTESSKYYTDADSTVMTDIDLEGDSILRAFLAQRGREHSYYVLWNKIYRRELLAYATKETMSASEGIDRFNYSEDALINFFAFSGAKKVVNLHTGYYFYRIHPAQSVSVTAAEKLRRQADLISLTLDTMLGEVQKRDDRDELSGHIEEWRSFICRSHYTHAKSGGFTELYPYLKEKYNRERLKRSTYRDEICGMRCKPLPDNFDEIDAALLEAWRSSILPKCQDGFAYAKKSVNFIKETKTLSVDAEITLPKAKVPFKKKLRFNPTLMRIARILFPKGSKIRAFLKRHM